MLSLIQSQDLETQFKKEFSYSTSDLNILKQFLVESCKGNVKLPVQENLKKIKVTVNEVKSKLSHVDISCWHKHTSHTNPAGKIVHKVRCEFESELCTQAWCKFYDILSHSNIIPNHCINVGQVDSVHLCEAPGAFITALNHRIHTSFKSINKFNWMAFTLNPYYEGNDPNACIVDDRLIYLTPGHWFFGSDNTGDILCEENLKACLQKIKSNFPSGVDVVTADGSFNCQNNPADQEYQVQKLLYTETYTALSILKTGGSFVLKAFTLFETYTVILLYILNCTFHSIKIRKPSVSKPGNSELYVIATDYKGVVLCQDSLDVMWLLINNLGREQLASDETVRFPNDCFLEEHVKCVEYFSSLQIQTIEENLTMFMERKNSHLFKKQARIKDKMYDIYKSSCSLTRLSEEHRIISSGDLCYRKESNVVARSYLKGSFDDRMHGNGDRELNKNLDINLNYNNWSIKRISVFESILSDILQLSCPPITTGEVITKIYFSIFCSTKILENLDVFSTNVEVKELSHFTNILIGNKEIQDTMNSFQEHDLYEIQFDRKNKFGLFDALQLFFKLKSNIQPSCESNKCDVVVIQLTSGCVSQSENQCSLLLGIFLQIQQKLTVGGSLLIAMKPILRRSTAGLIQLLGYLFKELTVFPLLLQESCENLFGCVVVVGTNYCPKEKLWNYIHNVNKSIDENDKSSASEVLEVIQIKYLIEDKEYLNLLKNANENLLNEMVFHSS